MTSKKLSVGEWEVDPSTGEIVGPAGTVHLEPKVMQVLVYFAERAGETVPREEILADIWGSRGAVSDEPLTRCVKVLRRELGDTKDDPLYIRTIHKVGYQLVADVSEVTDDPPPSPVADSATDIPGPTPISARRFPFIGPRAALIGFAVVVVLFIAWTGMPGPETIPGTAADGPAEPVIAVLPFRTNTGIETPVYLGEGFALEMRRLLGRIPDIRIAGGPPLPPDANPKDVAAELGADYLLDGTLMRDGDELHVYVQLINGADGIQVWNDRKDFKFEPSRVFAVYVEFANTTVEKLVELLALTSNVPRFNVVAPTSSTRAYDFYLRGEHHLNLRTPADLQLAIDDFSAAIAEDPAYGMPYVAMAYAESLRPASRGELDTRESFERARDILRTASNRDSSVTDAAIGVEAFIDLRDGLLARAYSGYQRSLGKFPSEPILHHGVSLLMSTVGHHEGALKHAREAYVLDKLSPIANGRMAVSSLWLGLNDDAEAFFNQSFDLGLDTVQNMQAYLILLIRTGQYEKARGLGHRLETELGITMSWWDTFVDNVADTATRESAVDVIRNADDFGKTVEIMQLGALAMLGENDAALDVLERIFATNPTSIGGFLFSEELAGMREDQRFAEIVATSPIAQFWVEYGPSPQCRTAAGGSFSCS